MAYLFGPGGKLVLMGIVEPGVRTQIDSRGTAEALVLIACEAALYGPAMEVAVREVLRTHAVVEPGQILHQPGDLALDQVRLLAHARVFEDRLDDLDRQHEQRRRDDDAVRQRLR